MIKAVRGTRDLLPPDTALWNFVEAAVRDVFRAYNFQEIRTPIFESTELFARGVGEETDIVSKEMYTWEDGGGSADNTLLWAWLQKHHQEVEIIPPAPAPSEQRTRLGPGVQVTWNGKWTIVRARYGATHTDLLQLQHTREAWKAMSNGKPLVSLLATKRGSVSDTFPLIAKNMGIEVEELDVPNLDAPRFLTLRPENTAGVVRAYIEHHLEKRGLNKLYYIGPQFRRERPQKGRFRQFFQIGAEVIGPPSSGSERPVRDAELLEMLDTMLRRLGIDDFSLQLNSVGDSKDRARYNETLRAALRPVVASMCTDCQRRAVTNPLRVFDCKVPADQPIIQTLPLIGDYLGPESKEHFDNIQALLKQAGVPFEVNHRLVRGLDYYTRTAFEFTHGALGAQNAILGGGRYDGLSESLGGPAAPGIGFAIGEDRLVLALQEQLPGILAVPDAYIAPVGEGMNRAAIQLAKELRREGMAIELGDRSYKLGKLLETAARMGARYAVIVGENEVNTGIFQVKNLATGDQVSVARADLPGKIRTS